MENLSKLELCESDRQNIDSNGPNNFVDTCQIVYDSSKNKAFFFFNDKNTENPKPRFISVN